MATMLMSRYDVLKVDGLDSDDENKGRKGNKQKQPKQPGDKQKQQKNGGGPAAQKQKPKSAGDKQQNNKDKQTKGNSQDKKSPQNNVNQAGAKQQPKPKDTNSGTNKTKVNPKTEEARWEEWRKLDESTMGETFEKDLHKALVASRLEYERNKQTQAVEPPEQQTPSDPNCADDPASEGKKKKNRKSKCKPAAMSLEEFNTPIPAAKPASKKSPATENGLDALPLRLHPEGEAMPNYFDDIDSEADTVLQLGQAYDEYQKQFAQESVRVQKLEGKLKRRDMEIAMLQTSLQKKDDEFQQVKKRNKQLLVILGQGEMKDKAEILIQADSLSQVNSELTEQVMALTAELEKERSKVHGLESEVERLKSSGRHHSGK